MELEFFLLETILNEIEFRQKQIDALKGAGCLTLAMYHEAERNKAQKRANEYFELMDKGE